MILNLMRSPWRWDISRCSLRKYLAGLDAYAKGQWQNHHTADVAIGLATTFLISGPWGWAAAGAYFLIDVGFKSYSGKSITEHLFD
jgi:hypothetical protein